MKQDKTPQTQKWQIVKRPPIHVMPDDGRHEDSPKCWCEPVLEYKDDRTDTEVWVHRDTRPGALQ